MWKKIAVAGATAAVILGAGTAAIAATGSSSSTPSAGSSTAAGTTAKAGKHKHQALERLRDFEHGTWVTKKGTATVTHTATRGSATAVSATSITVKAADGTTQTYVVNGSTKVHTRAQHKGAAITAVKPGDQVAVAGTGTGTVTATQVLDLAKK